jgi:hypothetical protein
MQKRKLGKSNLEVSAHGGLKCPRMPGNQGPRGPVVWAGFRFRWAESAQEPAHGKSSKTREISAEMVSNAA